MKVIIKRTLEETLRLTSIILVILAGVAGGYVVGINCNHSNATTFVKYLNECLIIQHMAVFFLINGAILMIIVASIASGLIAGEVHEGTIRLLVAKPNSRRSILLGKIIGMLTGCIILMLMGLGVFFLTESYFGNFDGNVQAGMLAYFPAYILYGLIVIAFFSSLATLLSCLVKKKVIALLPMLFLMICILALPVIVRVVLMFSNQEGYPSPLLYGIDVNYHFGSLFKWCCDFCGGINGTSSQLDMPALLLNIFHSIDVDRDLTHTNQTTALLLQNNIIPVTILLIVYGALTVFNYLSSFVLISRKDV